MHETSHHEHLNFITRTNVQRIYHSPFLAVCVLDLLVLDLSYISMITAYYCSITACLIAMRLHFITGESFIFFH